jgi:hypothetical protein
MGEDGLPEDGRVSVVKIRDRLVVYPVDGRFTFPTLLQPANGVFRQKRGQIRFFCPDTALDQTILITGCDPALSLLAAHAARVDPNLRMRSRFGSTHAAMDRLARGKTHLAGVHLQNSPEEETNVALAFDLDFVPLAEVRCDLVIPADLVDIPGIRIILDVLQSRGFRDELSLLPGYSQKKTGATIAAF